jgi:hypothetical protein
MKRKIVGFIISTLLIATLALPTTAFVDVTEDVGTTLDDVSEVLLPEDELDQYQREYFELPPGTIWNHSVYKEQFVAQTFKPSLPILTRIRLFMRKSTPFELPDLFVSIQNNEMFTLGTVVKHSENVTENFSWIEFDFEPDITVKVGETHAIVLMCYCISPKSYAVAFGIDTDYDKGGLAISPDCGITWEPREDEDLCFETYGIPEEEPAPDLHCTGTLSWVDVEPGSTVTGSFTVKNIGDSFSELDWEIVEYPTWGEWSFTPVEGFDLTPEDVPVTVHVSVVAPDVGEQSFYGNIKIVNKEDVNDSSTIEVSLVTPVSRNSIVLLEFFERVLERFPMLERCVVFILQKI